jgi:hypothetical protein
MMPETVREMWDEYARDVMPRGASAIQVQETRRAFYAAAWAMHQALAGLAEGSNEDGCVALTLWEIELRRFLGDVAAGRA